MYNVKGPSKIVAKTTRRGLPQNIDTFRDHSKSKPLVNEQKEIIRGPKPVFQTISKKCNNNCTQQETITQQHEELIKYINDSWNSIYAEVSNSSTDNSSAADKIVFYKDDPCPYLQNFKPFDLEGWWGKRLYNYITNSVNHNS